MASDDDEVERKAQEIQDLRKAAREEQAVRFTAAKDAFRLFEDLIDKKLSEKTSYAIECEAFADHRLRKEAAFYAEKRGDVTRIPIFDFGIWTTDGGVQYFVEPRPRSAGIIADGELVSGVSTADVTVAAAYAASICTEMMGRSRASGYSIPAPSMARSLAAEGPRRVEERKRRDAVQMGCVRWAVIAIVGLFAVSTIARCAGVPPPPTELNSGN